MGARIIQQVNDKSTSSTMDKAVHRKDWYIAMMIVEHTRATVIRLFEAHVHIADIKGACFNTAQYAIPSGCMVSSVDADTAAWLVAASIHDSVKSATVE